MLPLNLLQVQEVPPMLLPAHQSLQEALLKLLQAPQSLQEALPMLLPAHQNLQKPLLNPLPVHQNLQSPSRQTVVLFTCKQVFNTVSNSRILRYEMHRNQMITPLPFEITTRLLLMQYFW